MTKAQKYESEIMKLHDNAPMGFNPDFRAGLSESVSNEYSEYCEENPDVTREERKIEYRRIHDSLRNQFPSRRELSQVIGHDLTK
jgi:hypothetical protein